MSELSIDGPPVSFSEREWPRPWMGKFLDAMATSPVAAGAARAAGVNRQWAYQCAERWPEFAAAWQEAREVGIDLLEQNAIRWSAVGMEVKEVTRRTDASGNLIDQTERTTRHMSPTLAIFILKRFRPEYRDTHTIEHAGAGGGPVRLEVDRMPTRERMLELAQLAQKLGLPAGVDPIIDVNGNGNGASANGHE